MKVFTIPLFPAKKIEKSVHFGGEALREIVVVYKNEVPTAIDVYYSHERKGVNKDGPTK